ncbi:MAG: hypothetical protein ACYC28_12095 [Longimicrobiales bacterium]
MANESGQQNGNTGADQAQPPKPEAAKPEAAAKPEQITVKITGLIHTGRTKGGKPKLLAEVGDVIPLPRKQAEHFIRVGVAAAAEQ